MDSGSAYNLAGMAKFYHERMDAALANGDREITLSIADFRQFVGAAGHADAAARKLAAFKGYVHERLDAAGIPTHPDGPHSEEGCRVGDRLDLALEGHKLSEEDFIECERCVLRSWHEDERLSQLPPPDEDTRTKLVAAVISGLFLRNIGFRMLSASAPAPGDNG